MFYFNCRGEAYFAGTEGAQANWNGARKTAGLTALDHEHKPAFALHIDKASPYTRSAALRAI